MTILPFPSRSDASEFDPETLGILTGAFEDAWQSLQTVGTSLAAIGRRSKRANSLPAASLRWQSLAKRTGTNYETQPLRTWLRRIFATHAIERGSVRGKHHDLGIDAGISTDG